MNGFEGFHVSQLAYDEDETAHLDSESHPLRDALPDDILNIYVRLAASVCEVPVALVSICESDGQRFRAAYGLDDTRAGLQDSFCVHAVERSDRTFVVPVTSCDRTFADTSRVNGKRDVRFHAGVPLTGPSGAAVGTLCVMGYEPRSLDTRAKSELRLLGDAVMASLSDGRRKQWRHEASPFLFEHNPNPMWIYDLETLRFLAVNDAATRQYGYSRSEFLAMTLRDIRPASDVAALINQVQHAGHGLSHSKGWKHVKRDGTSIDVTITSEEVRHGDRPARLVLATDITRETQAEAALAHLVHHDALTGVLNRLGLDRAFAEVLARSRNAGTGGAVLFLDLERFKTVNDNYGHAAGDALLVCVAQRLCSSVRQNDVVARTGGDEFVVVAPGLDSGRQSERFIADILAAIRSPFSIDTQTHSVGITVGVSFFPADGMTATALLATADAAMYRAKRSLQLPVP